MHQVAAKLVLHLIADQQKENRVYVYQQVLEQTNDDVVFMQKIITGDEKSVYDYDFETKVQSPQWFLNESPVPKGIVSLDLIL
ncbi:hypothetical protein Trydic_g7603 [Trypoxylus dichotomus]